jgi:hypothetical protein
MMRTSEDDDVSHTVCTLLRPCRLKHVLAICTFGMPKNPGCEQSFRPLGRWVRRFRCRCFWDFGYNLVLFALFLPSESSGSPFTDGYGDSDQYFIRNYPGYPRFKKIDGVPCSLKKLVFVWLLRLWTEKDAGTDFTIKEAVDLLVRTCKRIFLFNAISASQQKRVR